MVDKDGKGKYSAIVQVNADNNDNISIFPNPAKSFVTIKGEKLKKVEVLNTNGIVAFNKRINSTVTTIPFNNFNIGLYLFKLTDTKGDISVRKIIKIK